MMSDTHITPSVDLIRLRRLCDGLAQWAFTDFQQARTALQELEAAITPRLPFDIRLAYHQHRAFLENQWRHFDQSLEHFDRAIGILESLADPLPLAEVWLDVAAVHLNQRDWPAVQQCLDRARRYLNQANAPNLQALLACREGFLNLHLGNHRLALEKLQEAERGLLGLGDQARLKDYYV